MQLSIPWIIVYGLAMVDLASLKKAVTFERKRLTEICKLITLQ